MGSDPLSSLVLALFFPKANKVALSLDRLEEGEEQARCRSVVCAGGEVGPARGAAPLFSGESYRW